jgi:small-conductance mechanosensitive channel
LRGLHLALMVVVALVVLDAWHAFDLSAWLDSERGRATVAVLVRVGIVLAIAALSWTVLASLIEHRVGARNGHKGSEREKTLLMLFRNAAAITIATMTVLVVLSQIGIDIGPLIAGAGVVGLAIAFGAQKLVQDVITGVFIQLENGMNQNDIVEVAGRFGTVEKITIRSVVIRTLDGGYHLIPFSVIDTVSNHTRDFGYHYAEYNIAHREDVDQAVAELELTFKDLMQDPVLAAEVLADIEIPGVTALNERGFSVRVLIKTTPGNQWMIQRAFNRLMKRRFDAAGIELPYPHTVLHFGRDENGHAQEPDAKAIEALRQSTRQTS